jgi:hypothetical protein
MGYHPVRLFLTGWVMQGIYNSEVWWDCRLGQLMSDIPDLY